MKTKTIADWQNSGGFENMCWTKTAPPPPETPTLSGRVDADVVVVGGGYTGLSTALHLAEAGKSAVLLEAKEIGWGASGRNGGIVFASWLNVPPEKAILRFGPQHGERMNRMMASAAKLVPHLIEKYAMTCDFRRTGMLGVAETKTQILKMHSLAEQWERYGVKADHIPAQKLSDYIATDKYAEGVLYPESGHLNPLGYVRGLARAAQSAGASLYTHSPATNIEQQGECWKVSSNAGEVIAHSVVIGTNAYTDSLWPKLNQSFYRITSAQFATDPHPDGLKSILRKGVLFHDNSQLRAFGVVSDRDGRLVGWAFPGVSYSRSVETIALPYERKLRRIFPHFPKPQWRHLWFGNVCVMPDLFPKVYNLAPGVFAALGYSGLGMCAATAVGSEIASLLVTGEKLECAMPISQLKRAPLARFAPQLARCVLIPFIRQLYRF